MKSWKNWCFKEKKGFFFDTQRTPEAKPGLDLAKSSLLPSVLPRRWCIFRASAAGLLPFSREGLWTLPGLGLV